MKRLTTKQFIERAKTIHGDTYDYSRVVYTSNKAKIEIICRSHGIYAQIPLNHLNGRGCPICGKRTLTTKNFLEKAIAIHGGKYDYSRVKYTHSKEKVKIICKKHGHFLQAPENHTRKHGCPKCHFDNISKRGK